MQIICTLLFQVNFKHEKISVSLDNENVSCILEMRF